MMGWLGAKKGCSTIVLVVFSRGGLVVSKICRFNLFRIGEELLWEGNFPKTNCVDIVHLLEFSDVTHDFWCVCQARGRFFCN